MHPKVPHLWEIKKVTENKTAVDTAVRFNTCLLKIEGEKYGITAWEWENSFSSACVQQFEMKMGVIMPHFTLKLKLMTT